jgi:hypothetical protein
MNKLINSNIELFLPNVLKNIESQNTLFLPDPDYAKKLSLLKKMKITRDIELVGAEIRLGRKTALYEDIEFEFSHSLSRPTLSLTGRLSFNVFREYNYNPRKAKNFISTKVKMNRDIDVVLNVFDHQILEDMYLDYMTY